MRCPGFEMITNLVEGQMKEKKIEVHLQTCGSCTGTAEWVQQIVMAMKSHDLVDAPEYVVARGISAFPKKRSFNKMIHALLRFDSWAEPMAAGVRSSQNHTPRQLMYQTEDYHIYLMLLPSRGAGSVLLGQLVPSRPDVNPAGRLVQLKMQNRVLSHEKTSDSGEFYLQTRSRRHLHPGADAKSVDLLIYRDNDAILLSDITGMRT